MNIFKNIEPASVWNYFEEICTVPRPSKKEEQMIDFLLKFGKENGLQTTKDEIGNILIKKPATKGYENKKTVLLQSHIDMVCEKNTDVKHDFEKDPILPYIDGNWVRAKGTTLGADCGIGIAAQMALLTATDIEHGAIECLFTVDEETGLTGAFALKSGFFDAPILLNLDSEDEGELFIGCAGGVDSLAYFDLKQTIETGDFTKIKVSITTLTGGHSGDDIHKGKGNAVKLMNRFLWNAETKFNARIINFDAGNLRNAIAREAFAEFIVPTGEAKKCKNYFTEYMSVIKSELSVTEPDMAGELDDKGQCTEATVLDSDLQSRLLKAVYACPHGVFAWSQDMPGLVETSTNLASVKFEDKKIVVTTSQRSSLTSAKDNIADMVATVFQLAGADVVNTDGYPGWKPNTNSEILKITETAYNKLFGKQPIVRAIHAGLECGLFLEKYPSLDMISFGPTIRGAHSPAERLDIETTQKFWTLLLEVLKNIPNN